MGSVSSLAPTTIRRKPHVSACSRLSTTENASQDPVSRDPTEAFSQACQCCSTGKMAVQLSLTGIMEAQYDLSSDAETMSPSHSSSSLGSVSRSSSGNSMASLESPEGSADVVKDNNSTAEMLEQSPIDIHEKCSDPLPLVDGNVTISLAMAEAELVHQGTNFSIRWKSAEHSTLVIRNKVFHAIQFHFHYPSEHTIDGQHEAMEFHMVHQAHDGTLAVIAVFFREGSENAFLAQFWNALPGLDPHVDGSIPVGEIDPQALHIHTERLFRYRGSLTTPPYSEGVEWVIIHDAVEASLEQLDTFRNLLLVPNARPVQPLNRRRVSLMT